MFKLIIKLCVLLSLYDFSNAAQPSANTQFGTTCTVEINPFTNQAKSEYVKASASVLFSKSPWISRWMTQMYQNVDQFISQVTTLNTQYQTGNQYVASTQMRDEIATVISILNTARSVAVNAQVSDIKQGLLIVV